MLYKLNKDGFVVNQASLKKIKPRYKEILREVVNLYQNKLNNNLLNVYVRGSVSVGKNKPGVSDIDTVAVIKKKLSKKKLLFLFLTYRSPLVSM